MNKVKATYNQATGVINVYGANKPDRTVQLTFTVSPLNNSLETGEITVHEHNSQTSYSSPLEYWDMPLSELTPLAQALDILEQELQAQQ